MGAIVVVSLYICVIWYCIGVVMALIIFAFSVHSKVQVSDIVCLFVSALRGVLQLAELTAVLKGFVQTRPMLQKYIWRKQ